MPNAKSEREQRKERLRKKREQESESRQGAGTGGTLEELIESKGKIQEVPRDGEIGEDYDSDDIAETVAIAKKMMRKKGRRDILEASYNRYCFATDETAPAWFKEDEHRHYRPNLPVTKEEVDAQKQALREYNSRPIKKVAEARIRKKKRLEKAMTKAKQKAIQISAQSELTEASRARQISQLYKKTRARVTQKKEKVYAVSSKGGSRTAARAGKKLRAKGAPGKKVQMVDKRMMKDKRAEKRVAKRKK